MATRLQVRAGMVVACVALALAFACAGARADEVPLVTGELWMKSTEQMKKAYLVGMANVIQVDTAYHAASPPSDSQSIVPRVAKGLKGHTLDSVREGLDRWYAANPARIQRPVLETMWFELVLPGLQKTN
jgi:hypothetical protein